MGITKYLKILEDLLFNSSTQIIAHDGARVGKVMNKW